MNAVMSQRQFDLDFDAELPPQDFFPLWQLAKIWRCSLRHVINLVETGELPVPIDLRGHGSTKSMIRAPRKCVIEFLNKRKVRQ